MRLRDDDQTLKPDDDNRLHHALIRQRAIGTSLRHRWNDIAREKLPDDMVALLEQLEDHETRKKASKKRAR